MVNDQSSCGVHVAAQAATIFVTATGGCLHVAEILVATGPSRLNIRHAVLPAVSREASQDCTRLVAISTARPELCVCSLTSVQVMLLPQTSVDCLYVDRVACRGELAVVCSDSASAGQPAVLLVDLAAAVAQCVLHLNHPLTMLHIPCLCVRASLVALNEAILGVSMWAVSGAQAGTHLRAHPGSAPAFDPFWAGTLRSSRPPGCRSSPARLERCKLPGLALSWRGAPCAGCQMQLGCSLGGFIPACFRSEHLARALSKHQAAL